MELGNFCDKVHRSGTDPASCFRGHITLPGRRVVDGRIVRDRTDCGLTGWVS